MGQMKKIVMAVKDDDMSIPAEVYEEAIVEEARKILMNQAECND